MCTLLQAMAHTAMGSYNQAHEKAMHLRLLVVHHTPNEGSVAAHLGVSAPTGRQPQQPLSSVHPPRRLSQPPLTPCKPSPTAHSIAAAACATAGSHGPGRILLRGIMILLLHSHEVIHGATTWPVVQHNPTYKNSLAMPCSPDTVRILQSGVQATTGVSSTHSSPN